VLGKLGELPQVIEADSLYFGPYDIIVRVEADTIEDLNTALGTDLKRIPNITSSVTLIKNEDLPS
jgi:DNA-binding Lrp family transcriptional regulator